MRAVSSTAARLAELAPLRPRLAIVLGTGFHQTTSRLHRPRRVPYAQLPGFPRPGVDGHAGMLWLGSFGPTPVCVLSGRSHYYEGYDMAEVTFPIRVLAEFGVRDLLLTNAAGGVNRRFRPGDFMCLTDHINLMGTNPLRGPAWAERERFVDLTEAYDRELAARLRRAARALGIRLHRGVYLAVSGPSYETPAEIRAFRRLGADAVGMSTVPEVVVARQCGLRVAAVSCITNLAAGKGNAFLSHADVLALSARVGEEAAAFIELFSSDYATQLEDGRRFGRK